MQKYIVKVNGEFFAGVSKDKVYQDGNAQQAFRCLVNICAKPDGLHAFEFTGDPAEAKRMDFYEVSHNFIQMLDVRVRYKHLEPVESLEIIKVEGEA